MSSQVVSIARRDRNQVGERSLDNVAKPRWFSAVECASRDFIPDDRRNGLSAASRMRMLAAMGLAECEILSLPHGPAAVTWRRSARARRVSLRIDPRGATVVVTLPPRAARTAGMALLMNHAAWVAARLAALPGARPFAAGALVKLHGRELVIRHVPRGAGPVRVEDGALVVPGDGDLLQGRVSAFFRAEAVRAFSAAVTRKASMIGASACRVVVKDTKSRWGSCSADGTIALSWRLVMAPRFVQDYVTAHEVAHLRHMDHGAQFWALARRLTPHTDGAVAWLREEGPGLLRVG